MSNLQHISTGKDSFQAYRTPPRIYKGLDEEFGFVLDAAADSKNTLCPVFFDGTEGSDGLIQPWNAPSGSVFCNPPYRNTAKWLAKAYSEVHIHQRCNRAVFLVPASVGVEWFTEASTKAEIQLFDQRIAFDVPPFEELPPEYQAKLYKNGKPVGSPGGGSCVVIVERDGLIGVTGMRSSETGRMIASFV